MFPGLIIFLPELFLLKYKILSYQFNLVKLLNRNLINIFADALL
jgi:hypothetical protein